MATSEQFDFIITSGTDQASTHLKCKEFHKDKTCSHFHVKRRIAMELHPEIGHGLKLSIKPVCDDS